MRIGTVLHMQLPADADDGTSPGQKIRSARENIKLSREKLAQQAAVSTSTVIRLERDDRLPNVTALVRIASCVGVPVSDLIPAPEQVA